MSTEIYQLVSCIFWLFLESVVTYAILTPFCLQPLCLIVNSLQQNDKDDMACPCLSLMCCLGSFSPATPVNTGNTTYLIGKRERNKERERDQIYQPFGECVLISCFSSLVKYLVVSPTHNNG